MGCGGKPGDRPQAEAYPWGLLRDRGSHSLQILFLSWHPSTMRPCYLLGKEKPEEKPWSRMRSQSDFPCRPKTSRFSSMTSTPAVVPTARKLER
jgi:hypothetical protein